MANFIEALSAGLDAANRLAADREEIDAVLAQAASQVASATRGAVGLALQGFARKPSLRDLVSMNISLTEDTSKKVYTALVFVSPAHSGDEQNTSVELAEWAATKGGYPVKLRYESVEDTCHDRQALESGIFSVLASPISGQKLRSLLRDAGISSLETTANRHRKTRQK